MTQFKLDRENHLSFSNIYLSYFCLKKVQMRAVEEGGLQPPHTHPQGRSAACRDLLTPVGSVDPVALNQLIG